MDRLPEYLSGPYASNMARLLNCLIVGGSTPFAPPFNLCDEITRLYARIDRRQVQNPYAYRAVSSPFAINVAPEPNLEDLYGYSGIAGGVSPVVADGYCLMLAPLGTGKHTIEFGGTFGAPLSSPLSDITYHLTVAPSAQAQ